MVAIPPHNVPMSLPDDTVESLREVSEVNVPWCLSFLALLEDIPKSKDSKDLLRGWPSRPKSCLFLPNHLVHTTLHSALSMRPCIRFCLVRRVGICRDIVIALSEVSLLRHFHYECRLLPVLWYSDRSLQTVLKSKWSCFIASSATNLSNSALPDAINPWTLATLHIVDRSLNFSNSHPQHLESVAHFQPKYFIDTGILKLNGVKDGTLLPHPLWAA